MDQDVDEPRHRRSVLAGTGAARLPERQLLGVGRFHAQLHTGGGLVRGCGLSSAARAGPVRQLRRILRRADRARCRPDRDRQRAGAQAHGKLAQPQPIGDPGGPRGLGRPVGDHWHAAVRADHGHPDDRLRAFRIDAAAGDPAVGFRPTGGRTTAPHTGRCHRIGDSECAAQLGTSPGGQRSGAGPSRDHLTAWGRGLGRWWECAHLRSSKSQAAHRHSLCGLSRDCHLGCLYCNAVS